MGKDSLSRKEIGVILVLRFCILPDYLLYLACKMDQSKKIGIKSRVIGTFSLEDIYAVMKFNNGRSSKHFFLLQMKTYIGKDIPIWNLNQNGTFSIASVKKAIAEADMNNANNTGVFKKTLEIQDSQRKAKFSFGPYCTNVLIQLMLSRERSLL